MGDGPSVKEDMAGFIAAIRSLEESVRDHKMALSHMADHTSATISAQAQQQRLHSPTKVKSQAPKKSTKV